MSDKNAAITAERSRFPVRLMCRAPGVSERAYYAAQRRVPGPRAVRRVALRQAVRAAFEAADARYGASRLLRDLQDAGERTSERMISACLRAEALVVRRCRRWRAGITIAAAHALAAPNHLAQDFAIRADRALNSVWVSDITEIPTVCKYTQIPAVREQANSRTRVGLFKMKNDLRIRVGVASASRAVARGARRVHGAGSCARRYAGPAHDAGADRGSQS